MSDDWTETGTITDATGKRVSIAHAGKFTRFAIVDAIGTVLTAIVLDADGRLQFSPAYITASCAAASAQAAAPRHILSGGEASPARTG